MAKHRAHPSSASEKKHFNFLGLPLELRHKIYCYVLISHMGFIFISQKQQVNSNRDRLLAFSDDGDVEKHFKVSLDLLRVCHQIYAESRHIIYQKNVWKGTRSLSLIHLVDDISRGSCLPLIQRLEIIYLGDHRSVRVANYLGSLIVKLNGLAFLRSFKELTLVDSLLGRVGFLIRTRFKPSPATRLTKGRFLANLNTPPLPYGKRIEMRMKFVRKACTSDYGKDKEWNREWYNKKSQEPDFELTIQNLLMDIHYAYGIDVYFEEHLLWHDYEPVETFKLQMF